jgi:hypothetical protein
MKQTKAESETEWLHKYLGQDHRICGALMVATWFGSM